MTRFLLQTYAIAGVRAELHKWEEEYDYYQEKWEQETNNDYKERYEKRKEDAWKNISDCKRIITEIENYEF